MKSAEIRRIARLPDVKRLPDFEDAETGRTLPMFEFGGFINTLEGWNLFARCRANGDMKPYETAKALYDRERRMYEAQLCAEAMR